jgi:hypothetical protein
MLFNIRDDVSGAATAALVDEVTREGRDPGMDGFLIGRNFIPTPFPARFEWLCMTQLGADAPLAGGGAARVARIRAALSAASRNQVECELACPLPPRFADAAGVGVRHTVMFSFKPGTPAEARQRNVAAIRRMGELPMVAHYVVQPGDAAAGPERMEWQVIGDYASVADYTAYSSAPVHLAIREDFIAHTSRVAFLDVKL